MAAVILDADGRYERMAETDEIGVIAINGPNVFSGYLDPRHNEGLWIEIDGERWLNMILRAAMPSTRGDGGKR
jgi:fatty-acyl-CoA synthase